MNGYACMCAGMSHTVRLCVCMHGGTDRVSQLDGQTAHFKKRRVLSSLITKQRAFGTAGKFTCHAAKPPFGLVRLKKLKVSHNGCSMLLSRSIFRNLLRPWTSACLCHFWATRLLRCHVGMAPALTSDPESALIFHGAKRMQQEA